MTYMNSRFIHGIALAALLGLGACGGSGDGNTGGGGGSDAVAPKVTGFSPADDNKAAEPAALIVISFDEALADAGSVKMIDADGYPVIGDVTLSDDKRNVTFTPKVVLDGGTRYFVTIANAADAAGNKSSNAAFSFATKRVDESLRRFNAVNGDPIFYEKTTRNEAHTAAITKTFANPGMDGTWFTDDDISTSMYHVDTLNSLGLAMKRVTWNVGADLAAGTDDDVAVNVWTWAYNEWGQIMERVSYVLGADGLADTADDEILSFTVHTYNDNGQLVAQTSYDAPGADDEWRTADDAISNIVAFSYNADGYIEYSYYGSSAGADGVFGTADDDVNFYYSYHFDMAAISTLETVIDNPGDDGVWYSGDEMPSEWTRGSLSQDGTTWTTLFFEGQEAATAAAPVPYMYSLAKIESRLVTQDIEVHGEGTDGTWQTEDDVIDGYSRYAYDNAGSITNMKLITSPGADGNWLNDDDGVFMETQYSE